MIVKINQKESAALTLHMAIMRKPFRNLMKTKYKAYKINYLASYDYILNEAKNALEANLDSYDLNLNIRDLEILNEFLRAYTAKVEKELKEQLQEVDKEQIQALKNIKAKCSDLIHA